jgi:CRP-like cAMP-binding protein
MQDLPLPTLARIDRFSTEARIAAGRTLMRQGAPTREAYIIVDGIAAVRQNRRVTATATAGDVAGATGNHGKWHNVDLIAVTDMTLLVATPAEFSSLCGDGAFVAWLAGSHKPGRAEPLRPHVAQTMRDLHADALAPSIVAGPLS